MQDTNCTGCRELFRALVEATVLNIVNGSITEREGILIVADATQYFPNHMKMTVARNTKQYAHLILHWVLTGIEPNYECARLGNEHNQLDKFRNIKDFPRKDVQ